MEELDRRPADRKTKSAEGEARGTEQSREALLRARFALKRADALVGNVVPRTPAERYLEAQRARLITWLKRFSLMGSLVAGNLGLYAGADYLGKNLHDRVTNISYGNDSPSNIDSPGIAFAAAENGEQDNLQPNMDEVGTASLEALPDNQAIGGDGIDPSAPDATVHQETEWDREQRVMHESALLIADELEQEGFFEHEQTVAGFDTAVESRLREMGITDRGQFENAKRAIVQRFREEVRDHAQHDIEGAMRMANKLNSVWNGIDSYELALEHHRPDLAAQVASNEVEGYRGGVQEVNADPEYADDPEGRAQILNDDRQRFVERFFGGPHADQASEVVRHLDRDERRVLASAIDAEIPHLQEVLATAPLADYTREEIRAEIERLQAGRRDL